MAIQRKIQFLAVRSLSIFHVTYRKSNTAYKCAFSSGKSSDYVNHYLRLDDFFSEFPSRQILCKIKKSEKCTRLDNSKYIGTYISRNI